MSNNPLFQRCVKALLEGEIICEYRHESIANYLASEDNLEKVNTFLEPLNRKVRQTDSGDAWLCAYIHLDTEEARANVRAQFNELANQIEPMVQWLRLAKNADSQARAISPGDRVTQSKLLESLENAQDLRRSLEVLTEKGLFKSSASKTEARLAAVLNKLTEMGYLIRLSGTGTAYQATGKWSWLYETLSFIQRHEGMDDTDEAPTADQMEAF